MSEKTASLSAFAQALEARLGASLVRADETRGETTIEVLPENWLEVARMLRDDADLHFEQLVDLCGVDYFSYADAEWDTTDVSWTGSRAAWKARGRAVSTGPIVRIRRISRIVSASSSICFRSSTTAVCACARIAPTTICRA
jgi:NADH:ubiquinone oxidoreductase subunit C